MILLRVLAPLPTCPLLTYSYAPIIMADESDPTTVGIINYNRAFLWSPTHGPLQYLVSGLKRVNKWKLNSVLTLIWLLLSASGPIIFGEMGRIRKVSEDENEWLFILIQKQIWSYRRKLNTGWTMNLKFLISHYTTYFTPIWTVHFWFSLSLNFILAQDIIACLVQWLAFSTLFLTPVFLYFDFLFS